jgi:glutamyl-tRNA synthetase
VFGDITPLVDDEDKDFVATAAKLLPEGELTGETWSQWTNAVKAETGRKGRGLFMTLRKALTGQEHGPDMGAILPLIGRERALKRLGG